MKHLVVRLIGVVGRIQDENDVQVELGITLFDPTSKDLKSPEPPPMKIEARALLYTLSVSHLDWACIRPSWTGQIAQPSFPEEGAHLSELPKRCLKHRIAPQTEEGDHPAVFEYLERFTWPQR